MKLLAIVPGRVAGVPEGARGGKGVDKGKGKGKGAAKGKEGGKEKEKEKETVSSSCAPPWIAGRVLLKWLALPADLRPLDSPVPGQIGIVGSISLCCADLLATHCLFHLGAPWVLVAVWATRALLDGLVSAALQLVHGSSFAVDCTWVPLSLLSSATVESVWSTVASPLRAATTYALGTRSTYVHLLGWGCLFAYGSLSLTPLAFFAAQAALVRWETRLLVPLWPTWVHRCFTWVWLTGTALLATSPWPADH